MAGLWPRTGNVTVTNGSKIVTGFGTKWKTGTLPIQKGHTFYGPDNFAYEVDTVVSDESLTLVEAYRGGTLANQGYRIDITRTSTISQFAADLASLVAKYRAWFDGMMTWLTGSGDVAILNPDTGANVTIPSWKKVASEGEGQTARAKVEADRAKTEADRALTEADRAAGIVAAAALPLPDVWAPLTDSLRLFTGYGREVKVGDDVIARMLTFSRSTTKTYTNRDGVLTTAAVNEPVFDQWGCSLDGAVTNYITMSEGLNQIGTEAGATVVTENGYKLVQYAGTGAISKDYIAAPNIPLTFSFYVKPAASDVVIALQVRDGTSPGKTAKFRVKPTGELIVDNSNSLLSGSNITRVSASLFRVSGTTVALDGSTYRIYRGDPVIGETFGSLQLENLQYASAYIPTNGAAATRSADLLTLQNPLNIPVGAGDMTVAVEVRRNPLAPSTTFPRIFHIGTHTWLVGDSIRFAMRGGTADQTQALKNALGTMETVVYRIKGDQITVRCGSAVATVTRTGAITSNNMVTNIGSDAIGVQNLFGHVRNLRVWRRALTDDQMKAIA